MQQSKISGGNIAVFQSVNRGTVEKANVKVDGGNIDKFYVGGETEDSTVDSNGVITGISKGSTTVEVTVGNKTKIVNVEVRKSSFLFILIGLL